MTFYKRKKGSKSKPRKIRTKLDLDEFKTLLRFTKKKKFKIAFLLAFGSGLRLSELVGYTRKDKTTIHPISENDINMTNNSILVRGKGKKERIVPVPKGWKDNYIQYLPLNKSYSNITSARRAMQSAFKRAARSSGLLEKKPRLHFHSLRHSFGSRMADSGVPIHHIKTLMGHDNIATTNVYLISNPKRALESYEELF